MGVVLFAMVTGYLPFHASGNKQELCQKIVRGQFECPEGLSAEVTDLLHRMLTVDPAARITFDEIMVRMDLHLTGRHQRAMKPASWNRGGVRLRGLTGCWANVRCTRG